MFYSIWDCHEYWQKLSAAIRSSLSVWENCFFVLICISYLLLRILFVFLFVLGNDNAKIVFVGVKTLMYKDLVQCIWYLFCITVLAVIKIVLALSLLFAFMLKFDDDLSTI